MDAIAERQNWLEKILSNLLSYKDGEERDGTPDEMIEEAGRKAFKISTALGLIPGPIGFVSILPEVVALTKLQINLIYRIARHYDRAEEVDKEIVLLILANVLGVAGGEALIRKAGSALVMRSANTRVVKALARKVGTHIIDTAAEKAIGRWIPFLTAPLFGYFSRSLTRKIGVEAKRLLSSGQLMVDYADR
jgi:hypothetical protein